MIISTILLTLLMVLSLVGLYITWYGSPDTSVLDQDDD